MLHPVAASNGSFLKRETRPTTKVGSWDKRQLHRGKTTPSPKSAKEPIKNFDKHERSAIQAYLSIHDPPTYLSVEVGNIDHHNLKKEQKKNYEDMATRLESFLFWTHKRPWKLHSHLKK
mmetsp:Transcript_5739/g.13514  ORF Transcript_5739/g.13514 Transcript_5739/m.13514 type:complete len:119 (+) Transcript_5739:522-878(+)